MPLRTAHYAYFSDTPCWCDPFFSFITRSLIVTLREDGIIPLATGLQIIICTNKNMCWISILVFINMFSERHHFISNVWSYYSGLRESSMYSFLGHHFFKWNLQRKLNLIELLSKPSARNHCHLVINLFQKTN